MKSFFKYLLTFVFGLIFGLAIIAVVILVAVSNIGSEYNNQDEQIPEKSILKLELPVSVKETSEHESLATLLGGISGTPVLSLSEIRSILYRAASDERVQGVHLDPGLYSGGLSIAQEIRDAIDTFQKSGKPVWAYSENYTEQGLFIATTCNKVVANPKGIAEFNGFSSGIMMYKGLLDKVGLDVQIFKVGKFKGAVEPYSQDALSEYNKEQINAYLNSLYQQQLEQIAFDRKTSVSRLDSFAKYGNYFDIQEVKRIGLLDELWYFDEFETFIQKKDKGVKWISAKKYLNQEQDYHYSENQIAVLYLEGEIVPGKAQNEDQIASDEVCKQLKKIRENDDIKAVVLRINSPGGSSMASDIIAREVALTKKKKPVIASFSNVAASGGYYIAALADSIFADEKSITGSIGVFAMIPNTQKLYREKLGLKYETIQTGPQSTLWRPDQPLNESQQRLIQQMINQVYEDFTGIVAKGRKLPVSKVKEIAEGRVYSGIQAKKIGLIDGFGGYQHSINAAATKAGISDFKVVSFPEPKDPFEAILEVFDSKSDMNIELPNSLANEFLQTIKMLESMEGIQARIPWSTDIQ